jgi:MFS family permease
MHTAPASTERNGLLLTGVGNFTSHFFELMFPTLAVALARQSQVPLDEVLGWSFFGYLAFGLGALPLAVAGDRFGTRLPLLVSLFGLGVASLAASEVTSPRALTICLAAMGALASVYHPLGMRLIARTRDGNNGRAPGIHGLITTLAIAFTPLLTAALCMRFGWQDAYRVVGYAMCALAVGCAFLPVDEPAAHPLRDSEDRAPAAWRPLLVLLLAASLAGVSYRGATLIQPAYFAERVSEAWFGAALSIAYLFGIAGQSVGARLTARGDRRRLYLLFHAGSLAPLLLMSACAGLALVASTAAFMFFTLGMRPIEEDLVARYAPRRRRTALQVAHFVCANGVGALAVWLVSAAAAASLSAAIQALAGVVVLVIAAAAVLVRVDARGGARRAPGSAAAHGAHAAAPPSSPVVP